MRIIQCPVFLKLIIRCLFIYFITSLSCYSADEATIQSEKWFTKADAEMNQVYHKVLKKLDAKKLKEFKEAQDAWNKYRYKDADISATISGGGSAYSMDYMANLAELTEERTKALKKILKMLE